MTKPSLEWWSLPPTLTTHQFFPGNLVSFAPWTPAQRSWPRPTRRTPATTPSSRSPGSGAFCGLERMVLVSSPHFEMICWIRPGRGRRNRILGWTGFFQFQRRLFTLSYPRQDLPSGQLVEQIAKHLHECKKATERTALKIHLNIVLIEPGNSMYDSTKQMVFDFVRGTTTRHTIALRTFTATQQTTLESKTFIKHPKSMRNIANNFWKRHLKPPKDAIRNPPLDNR